MRVSIKGVCPTPSLVLHHYQEAKPTPSFGPPGLVAFEPKDKKRYLLFLQPEADGRYVAVSGQTDPDDSIKPIADNYP